MTNCTDGLFVVTGGPGSGKSTLLAALAARGVATSEEAGRAIIRQQARIGGAALPWGDPRLYAETMLAWEMRSHETALRRPGPVVFDRGVPDVIGYLRVVGLPVPEHMRRAAALHRYNRTVFIAPPWPAIFAQDAERRQTLEEAERTFEAMRETYEEYGYALIELPRAPVEDRAALVIEAIGSLIRSA